MAHSASSAFLPERLKNGLQAVSSEGLIASFFFRLFSCRACLEAPLPAEVFARFCAMGEDLSPQEALLLKVLFAMMQLDFSRPTLLWTLSAHTSPAFRRSGRRRWRFFAG